jgi:hypothetical protein
MDAEQARWATQLREIPIISGMRYEQQMIRPFDIALLWGSGQR